MATPEFYSGKVLYPAIGVLLALSALFGLVILPRLSPADGGLTHKPAPDVTMPVAANGEPGARIRVSDLKGHPVVLDFWASWCGPCNLQAPILDRVARRFQGRGLVVLGIDVDDSADVAKSFAVKKGLSYPIVLDETKQASKLYDVDKLPSLVVIDKQGNVAAYLSGIVDESALDEMVSSLL
jgi:thiol-disulfide isomerase/thioredoxin